jgi:hypothetical protein
MDIKPDVVDCRIPSVFPKWDVLAISVKENTRLLVFSPVFRVAPVVT